MSSLKCLFLFFAIFSVYTIGNAQKRTVTELEPVEYNVQETNDLFFGQSHSIPKPLLGTLEQCVVRLPNGVYYEAYPEFQVPTEGIFFMEGSSLFRACGIFFRPISLTHTGTYQLISVVSEAEEIITTTQEFTMNVSERVDNN